MSEKPRAEWHGRSDFAEFAEALDVPTKAIMAVHQPHAENVLVLFSPDVEREPTKIFKTTLRRGVDGVLFVSETPEEMPDFFDQMRAQMERKLEADESLLPPENRSDERDADRHEGD